ncbi:olfactory receptor 52E4-like [Simochromis diagramma]|uniref:olfactory receptor 52E4-like n=1 Tax=Simochromis diagramma TaxID=43689 RepID=UPI001A7EE4DB|nr:olfactory receptor 52E4-like [Simochromis diagramma]
MLRSPRPVSLWLSVSAVSPCVPTSLVNPLCIYVCVSLSSVSRSPSCCVDLPVSLCECLVCCPQFSFVFPAICLSSIKAVILSSSPESVSLAFLGPHPACHTAIHDTMCMQQTWDTRIPTISKWHKVQAASRKPVPGAPETKIFSLYSYVGVEFLTLAVMSYDRYLAICCPLQYNTRMTSSTVSVLIAVSWIYALLLVAVTVSLSSPLQLCGNIINKVYCDNYAIVKLACSDTTLNNIYGLISTAFTAFVPVTLIFFTYMRILKVCFSGSKQMRQKAVSTCTPHLASLLNFSCSGCFEILQSRFNMNNLPNVLRILISLYWLMCQPLFNPVLYGLKMSKIRDICKCLLYSKVNTILS